MNRLNELERKVRELYELQTSGRADWADWLYKNHVFVVADYAVELARRFNANVEYSRAAAILHDIADAEMKRSDPGHEERSLSVGRDLLRTSGYTKEEVDLIIEDAVRFHSCHDGKIPTTLEGKVLATADSLAHLKTNFYEYFSTALKSEMTDDEIRQSASKKLDRDYGAKILFENIKPEVYDDYITLKAKFGS